MTLYPAIDLKDGKAVRLTKGLMESAKIYSDEPWQLVKTFEEMGAEWVHLVDLNGAFAGEPKNLEQIVKIRKNCNVKLELGGGIRDEATIQKMLDIGIDRITDLAREFADAGVEAIICTDVGRDGTLSGVNVDFTLDIARASKVATIASGGVKDEDDIKALIATKEIEGVIIGKAYYEGTLDLAKMFKLLN